ncbi:MAG: PDGLE domain-containing protein [Nocardioidaceae bacterium]
MKAKVSTKAFAVIAIVVCLALAGVVSYYAANTPDGLTRVASDHGLDDKQKNHATDDSPLAGYNAKGVADKRLSGGLAGVAGVVVVLAVVSGLTYVVRRRRRDDMPQD